MKKISQSSFLALFVFAISNFAHAQPAAATPEEFWKEFSPTAGRFKVKLPDNPTQTTQKIKFGKRTIQRHTFTLGAGFAVFSVSYADLPVIMTEPGEVNTFLDHMHEGEVASSKGKLLSMTEIELDGYPGREFKVETQNSMFRMKYYLVGRRFYQIAISTPTADHLARTLSADSNRLANDLEKHEEKDLANIMRENGLAKNAAEMARSMELFATEFFDSFKLTDKPAMGKKR